MTDSFKLDLGHRFKGERKRLRLSQGGLAKLLGCSQVTVSRYEKGLFAPDTDTLFELAKMGIDAVFIMTGERLRVHLGIKESSLLNLFDGLDTFRKQALLDVAAGLAILRASEVADLAEAAQ